MAASLLRHPTQQSVAIIGRGVLGSSIAYHLVCKQGYRNVTLIDKRTPSLNGNRIGAEWVNCFRAPVALHNLMRISMERLYSLDRAHGGKLPVEWWGALHVAQSSNASQLLNDKVASMRNYGWGVRQLTKEELKSLEPRLKLGETTNADLSDGDGIANSEELERFFINVAARDGLEVASAAVTSMRKEGTHWRLGLSGGEKAFDKIILASGSAVTALTPSILPGGALPLISLATTRVHLSALPMRILRNVVHVSGEMAILHQRSGETTITVTHNSRHPEPEDLKAFAASLRDKAIALIPDLRITEIERVSTTKRSIAGDGLPVLGFLDADRSVYAAVSPDPVSVCAGVGSLVSIEVSSPEGEVQPLTPFRPSRLVSAKKQ